MMDIFFRFGSGLLVMAAVTMWVAFLASRQLRKDPTPDDWPHWALVASGAIAHAWFMATAIANGE